MQIFECSLRDYLRHKSSSRASVIWLRQINVLSIARIATSWRHFAVPATFLRFNLVSRAPLDICRFCRCERLLRNLIYNDSVLIELLLARCQGQRASAKR